VTEEPAWKQYERQIHARLLRAAGGDGKAEVTFDKRLPGNLSRVDRQIDVYVEGQFANGIVEGTMAVDCKYFDRNVDVKGVETFIGLVEDVGTDFGLLVTTKGYSPAARERVAAARGVKIDIVPFEELEDWSPEVLFCPICTDLDSDRAPGPLYLDPVPAGVEGRELATGIGRCWTCISVSMRCRCGILNTLYEAEEGEWQECEGGCGVEWLAVEEIDRKGVPEGDRVAFRAGN
jgi:hypothetical protein